MIKYPDKVIVEMREMLVTGATLREVASRFNVDVAYVQCIKLNKNRTGLGPDASQVKAVSKFDKRRERARQLYQEGYSLKHIQDTLSMQDVTLYESIGASKRSLQQDVRTKCTAEAAALLKQGMPIKQISRQLDIPLSTMYRYLKDVTQSAPAPQTGSRDSEEA